MAEHILNTPFGDFTVDLFPPDRSSALRAWDAADLFLIDELTELPDEGPVLLVNDSHGALQLALSERECHHLNDSALSLAALSQNLEQNGLSPTIQPKKEGPYPLVLIKIPKTLGLLETQLREIKKCITPDTRIIGAGMTRHIHRSTLELFESILGPAPTSQARKKARLIRCTPDPMIKVPEEKPSPSYRVEGIPEPLINLPHLFSQERLDRGTALLLQFLRIPSEGKIRLADFGCGNGVIGIAAALKNPEAELWAVDDSLQALRCSRINGERNGILSRMTLRHGYGLEEGPYDFVLSNPPFHQGQKVDISPTLDFFKQAEDQLKTGGNLLVVSNSHLGFQSHLKRIFGNVRVLAERKGYILLESKKEV